MLCTPGDWKACVSVYLSSSRVLFAEDAIFGPDIDPVTRFSDKNLWSQWIDSLEKLSKLDISCIIPGHGRLCDIKEIPRYIEYIKD